MGTVDKGLKEELQEAVTPGQRVSVLYSFPHKLGAGRICYTAWQQVDGLAAAGAEVSVFTGVLHRPVAQSVKVRTTLSRGKARIPYRLLGRMRAFDWHDRVVARALKKMSTDVNIVHAWPLGALHTLQAAKRLGIPTVLERPNAHTRYAYESVREECKRLGVTLPPGYEHSYDAEVLRKEEQEYELADRLLCPSEFTKATFLERGFPEEKLVRHTYGYDETKYYPDGSADERNGAFTMLFAGMCAVRKGVHLALEAWLASPASRHGKFLIAGEFLPAYADRLSGLLAHPSVQVLGHRNDVPELMRSSDILVLPSIEEGFGLVCLEAMASGCVPLVSQACTEICAHMQTALVHRIGDVETLRQHITMVYEDRQLLRKLRAASIARASEFTWKAAGEKLLDIYRRMLEGSA